MSDTIGVVGWCGMRENASRLVDNQKMLVFKDKSNRNVGSWVKCRRLEFGNKNINTIVGFDESSGFTRGLVEDDVTLSDEGADDGA